MIAMTQAYEPTSTPGAGYAFPSLPDGLHDERGAHGRLSRVVCLWLDLTGLHGAVWTELQCWRHSFGWPISDLRAARSPRLGRGSRKASGEKLSW
jgi:hypothetical protein